LFQQFPDYLSKIQRPMSLDVIKKNLEPGHEGCYKSFTHFVADVRQIFKNAFIYNEVCFIGMK
jgi:Bromodomain